MAGDPVLLVLVGALGDLAWRKFLQEARDLENSNPDVAVLLVDVPWSPHPAGLDRELRWRIGRRLIELRAEAIYDDAMRSSRRLSISLKSDFGKTPFPWDIDDFVCNYLVGTSSGLQSEKQELQQRLDDWLQWFMSNSRAGLQRYSSHSAAVESHIAHLKTEGWRVAVFVATPPQAYPRVINQWSALADRIVLEKPASGLDPDTLGYPATQKHGLLAAAHRVGTPAQITTNDHYNAKLITRAMDRIRDYHLFDYLLDPARINRLVVQLLEPAPLPLGRCKFYNGAGGAFGDMVPHLLQAVRAILGLTTPTLVVNFQEFHWARYDSAPVPGSFVPLTGEPYIYDPGYYQPLHPGTETFVAFKATVDVGGSAIPLYCRTGKGFHQGRRTLRVDAQYDVSGSEVSLIFDFGSTSLTVRDDVKGFRLDTGTLNLNDPFRSGVPGVEREYKGIFECLVGSAWGPNVLDARYFPAVPDAANLADVVFTRLIVERQGRSTFHMYTISDPASYDRILQLLDDEAHWG